MYMLFVAVDYYDQQFPFIVGIFNRRSKQKKKQGDVLIEKESWC